MHVRQVTHLQLFSLGALLGLCSAPLWTKENQVADKKPVSIPQPIQDEDKREVQRLAYSPKLKLLASAPALYFRRGQIPVVS
jgi:hypothetical protein